MKDKNNQNSSQYVNISLLDFNNISNISKVNTDVLILRKSNFLLVKAAGYQIYQTIDLRYHHYQLITIIIIIQFQPLKKLKRVIEMIFPSIYQLWIKF